MVNLVSKLGILILLLFRPTTIFAIVCFIAGGVATIKSEVVHEKMEIFATVWDEAIQPEIDKGTQQLSGIVDVDDDSSGGDDL